MGKQAQGRQRRTAAEWKRLVRAWKRSGLSARRFAGSVPVSPRTLVWWQWRLAQPVAAAPHDTDQVGLVHLDVAGEGAAASTEQGPWWEMTAPSGCTLRVLRRLDRRDVGGIVEAFVLATVRS